MRGSSALEVFGAARAVGRNSACFSTVNPWPPRRNIVVVVSAYGMLVQLRHGMAWRILAVGKNRRTFWSSGASIFQDGLPLHTPRGCKPRVRLSANDGATCHRKADKIVFAMRRVNDENLQPANAQDCLLDVQLDLMLPFARTGPQITTEHASDSNLGVPPSSRRSSLGLGGRSLDVARPRTRPHRRLISRGCCAERWAIRMMCCQRLPQSAAMRVFCLCRHPKH